MLTLIELKNFKAFGRNTRIPLAPITLIFGENSAGKLTTARERILPNAFGYGELSIEDIQRGLLTSAELQFFD